MNINSATKDAKTPVKLPGPLIEKALAVNYPTEEALPLQSVQLKLNVAVVLLLYAVRRSGGPAGQGPPYQQEHNCSHKGDEYTPQIYAGYSSHA